MAIKLDTFTRAYTECALWSTTDNSDDSGGCALDDNYGVEDIAPDTLAQMIVDCKQFQTDNASDLDGLSLAELERAGHDFWLTRERHGAGFWDGGWSADVGSRLTDYCRNCGSFYLYVGDDGMIYG